MSGVSGGREIRQGKFFLEGLFFIRVAFPVSVRLKWIQVSRAKAKGQEGKGSEASGAKLIHPSTASLTTVKG